MSNEGETSDFGSQELTLEFSRYLLNQMTLFKKATERDLSDRGEELKSVILAISQTAYTIANLTPNGLLNECVMLGRGLLERSINFAYLLVCSTDEFERYHNYTVQKSYRRLNRSVTAGEKTIEIGYQSEIGPEDIPELAEALDMFTSKRGREITRWTQNGLGKRIEVIGDKSSVSAEPFMLCWLSIYEDASEALHGTFYGCTFDTGAYEPGSPRTEESMREFRQQNLALLNWEFGSLLNHLLHAANEERSLDDLCSQSSTNTKRSFDLMENHIEPSPKWNVQ